MKLNDFVAFALILIGLSSGAPSNSDSVSMLPGSKARNQDRKDDSNEIVVVAQEQTLSVTESTFGSKSMRPESKARNAAQSDLLVQHLSSSGALPLDSSGFFGIPAAAVDPELGTGLTTSLVESMLSGSKARNATQSDLYARLLSSLRSLFKRIQAFGTWYFGPELLNGQARAEEEQEDIITDGSLNCRFKTSQADAHALGVCPAGCYLLPLHGQCWCPINTEEDCETEKQCYWLVDAQAEGNCKHQSYRLYGLASLLNDFNLLNGTTITSDLIAQTLNGGESDLLTQLLNSLESKPGGTQALARLLNPPNTPTSTSDRSAQNLNSGVRMEEEIKESCRIKTINADALTGCPAGCVSLFPAIQGCLCPRNTQDDCETEKGCYWSAEGKCIHQLDALFKNLKKHGSTTDVTKEPNFDPDFDQDFSFAYSIALSPVAAAGFSTTGEIGVAFGSNGEVMGFAGGCLGLKADVSVELDVALGFWNSIDDIGGPIYQVGVGADTAELKNEPGTDETGAHVEQIYNSDGQFIGFSISLGRGYGVDLPIDWEINFDKCHVYELWRFHWRDLY